MTRLHVAVPEEFLFRMERTVGLSDINYAKHLDSVSMVKILHEARLQFLASLGFGGGQDVSGLHRLHLAGGSGSVVQRNHDTPRTRVDGCWPASRARELSLVHR